MTFISIPLPRLRIGTLLFLDLCPIIVESEKRTNIWTQCEKFRFHHSKKYAIGADVDDDTTVNFSTLPFGYFELGNIHHWG